MSIIELQFNPAVFSLASGGVTGSDRLGLTVTKSVKPFFVQPFFYQIFFNSRDPGYGKLEILQGIAGILGIGTDDQLQGPHHQT